MMQDMKRTKAERKADTELNKAPVDDYPYGLRVHLDNATMEKLGIKSLPKVGSKLHLHAHAHVVSAEERSHEGGKKHRSVSLELRKMELAAEHKASEGEVHEGNLTGAKAAMDKALDKQEGPDNSDAST
jgi:hypothetical protein